MSNKCNKIRFASRAEAKAWARKIAQSNRRRNALQKPVDMMPYRCIDCPPGTWHLTSKKGARNRASTAQFKRKKNK